MITQFENGFITKSKLNEMVDGINTNTSGLESFVSLTGSILFMATPIVPNGWLKADGLAVSRATYSRLFTAIGTTFGAGDGSTTFNLPDLRGEFIRGWDDGRGVDSGRVLGSYQADELETHNHTLMAINNTTAGENEIIFEWHRKGTQPGIFSDVHPGHIVPFGGVETRPRNIALIAIIKY